MRDNAGAIYMVGRHANDPRDVLTFEKPATPFLIKEMKRTGELVVSVLSDIWSLIQADAVDCPELALYLDAPRRLLVTAFPTDLGKLIFGL